MRIGIFGGTFNPPHIGHTEMTRSKAVELGLDLLIVVPTGMPPHKHLPPGTPSADMRLIMTQNGFSGAPHTLISDAEIFSNEPCYAIDTIKSVKSDYPGAELFLMVGTDMYTELDSWKDSKDLLKLVTPAELPRDLINISSTRLRELLPERKGREYVADLNYSYIIKHRLYGAKPDWSWLRERAHSMLAPGRIPHVDACEKESLAMAERWGVSTDDAREAAILHDITKKLSFEEHLRVLDEHKVSIGKLGYHGEKLLHSITGALLARSMFGVSDDVVGAIRWHTTGREKMTTLEKVIYLVDYIEETRDFAGLDALREKAYEDIDDAMIMGLQMSIDDLLERGITPNDTTYKALNDLVKEGKSK